MELWVEEEGLEETEGAAVGALGRGLRVDCIIEAETGKRSRNQGGAESIATEKSRLNRREVVVFSGGERQCSPRSSEKF